MEQLLHIGLWALGLFGGAHKLENILEHYIMDHVPDKFKPLVGPAVSVIGGVVAVVCGVDPTTAGLSAAGFAGYLDKVHNDPKTTSADWPLPPADPMGVPGDLPAIQ